MGKLTKMLWKPFANTSGQQEKYPEQISVPPSPEPGIQIVRVNDIDPEKLMEKLKLKFASDSGPKFKIHMMHNNYIIQASEPLMPTDLDECRQCKTRG